MARTNWQIGSVMIAGLASMILLTGCGSENQASSGGPSAPPAVIVETSRLQDLSAASRYTGRVEATDTVQIRARITGYLEERKFKEGDRVNSGDVLIQLEREPYQLALDQAKANFETATAARTLAQQTYDRYKTLTNRNVTSEAKLEESTASLQQAIAAVAAAKAGVDRAELNLRYTRITAPMDGLVGRAAYSPGAFVGPESGSLVTLVKQDPIYVTFPVPQIRLLQVRKEQKDKDGYDVEVILSDGSVYDQKGKIDFTDVQSTAATDSVVVRALVPNPNGLLIDRQVVEVRIVEKQPEKRLLISQSALLVDQQGSYVLVVGKDDKVAIQRIRVAEELGSQIVVSEGLEPGSRVIINGHQKARPGSTVAPQEAQNNLGASNSGATKAAEAEAPDANEKPGKGEN